jgi:hypothetical protein
VDIEHETGVWAASLLVEEFLTGGKGFHGQPNLLKHAAEAISDEVFVVHDEYFAGA